jgi:hypothetical protein
VVFHELMLDPEPAVALPEAEYIELYNRSGQRMSLKGWTLLYGETAYPFPDCSLDSAAYCLICSRASEKMFSPGKPLVAFASFPTLANAGKSIALLDERQELVAFLDYTASWYGENFKASGGWSLECIDAENLSGLSSNWIASRDASGGTPGYRNSVVAKNPDRTLPQLNRLYVLSPRQIELCFSKSLRPEALATVRNYDLSPSGRAIVTAVPGFPACRSVILNLNDSLVSGTVYGLRLSGLKDVSGLSLKDTVELLGLPQSPRVFDLSLNEVLFNPKPGGSDYIEFVNRSDRCVDLSRVWLSSRSASGKLDAGIRLSDKPLPCMPGSYWLLSARMDSIQSAAGVRDFFHGIGLPSFPSMPDQAGNVALLTSSAQIIDEMNYRESLHFPLIVDDEGVSLEKINPELASLDETSWVSSSRTSGFGTPGLPNSQYRELEETGADVFELDWKWLTPNNDGLEDRIAISYQSSEPGQANLSVYDLSGCRVRRLLENELLAAKGCLFWDGTNDEGRLVPAGRYILLAEAWTPTGKRNKKRFVLTVLF